ncbi:hypothetical protein ACHAPA_007969 [Fusarium lateritium]
MASSSARRATYRDRPAYQAYLNNGQRPDERLLPRVLQNTDGEYFINTGEVYCRWRSAADQMCTNTHQFSSASSLRSHYRKSHSVVLENRRSGRLKQNLEDDLDRWYSIFAGGLDLDDWTPRKAAVRGKSPESGEKPDLTPLKDNSPVVPLFGPRAQAHAGTSASQDANEDRPPPEQDVFESNNNPAFLPDPDPEFDLDIDFESDPEPDSEPQPDSPATAVVQRREHKRERRRRDREATATKNVAEELEAEIANTSADLVENAKATVSKAWDDYARRERRARKSEVEALVWDSAVANATPQQLANALADDETNNNQTSAVSSTVPPVASRMNPEPSVSVNELPTTSTGRNRRREYKTTTQTNTQAERPPKRPRRKALSSNDETNIEPVPGPVTGLFPEAIPGPVTGLFPEAIPELVTGLVPEAIPEPLSPNVHRELVPFNDVAKPAIAQMRRDQGHRATYKCESCKEKKQKCPPSGVYDKDCEIWAAYENPF